MLEIIYYIVIGISTGLLSGLLGVGGGIMTVPALVLMMQQHPAFHLANTMHIAASTSLVAMTMTSASSAYAYYRRKALVFQIFWKMLPGLCCGLVSGSMLSHAMSNTLLITLFAFFLIGVAIHLLFDAKRTMPRSADKYLFSKQRFSAHEHWMLIIGSFMVGNLSTIFGIGGGYFNGTLIFITPLQYARISRHLCFMWYRMRSDRYLTVILSYADIQAPLYLE